ncbi:MAG: adenylate/guanylate cyclase domain-containing protein [Clostridiales bacterium]|nr:adenylate/guanylate cyclase domain-containing protein [Clostridiales bacterium]
MKRSAKLSLLFSLIGAILITFIAQSNILYGPDQYIQDMLYQKPGVASADIVIIGIDNKAQQEFGNYFNWDRSVVASALEVLASDPNKLPAVVAIDALYGGRTEDIYDNQLVDAASKLDVITASSVEFDVVQTFGEDGVTISRYAAVGYTPPFELLRKVTTEGHINELLDTDGVMRHALLYVKPRQNVTVYSMAYQAARKYAQKHGQQLELPETNSRGHFYIPYTATPHTYYDDVSLADLINGDVNPDYYAGKIVLIGPYAEGLADQWPVPISRGKQMYGVEIQANVIQCILDGNYKLETPDRPQLILLFLASFFVLLMVFQIPFLYSSIICVILAITHIFVCAAFYNLGYIWHPLWLTGAMVLMLVTSIVVHYLSVAKQRKKVTSTLERYVAPNIVKELLREGTESLGLGGKLCDIAVLFVDVRGFTTMSENKDPRTIVSILNRYLAMTSSCIEQNEGTLDKFIGDATMAFWGAPLPQENAIYLASKTALEIVEGAEKLSKELKEEIGVDLRVGVGVHFGPAVVGNMGSEKHMDYTAVGDTVNTASRLESNAPGSTVYISRVVAEKLGEKAEVESLGAKVKLKGKAEGFEVLILKSLKDE